MPKRTSGEGTIYKTERGKYRAQIVVGGRRLSKTAASAKECRTWLKQQRLLAVQFHSHSYGEMTLNELIDTWLASIKIVVNPLTYHHYINRINKHIRPALGLITVEDITPVQIQSVIDTYMASGRWTNYTRRAFANLKTILKRATIIGAISFNPMDRVFMPALNGSDENIPQVWNSDQIREYAYAAEALQLRQANALKFAVGTGVRIGELLGLTWENVDLDRQEVSIVQQAVPVRGEQAAGLGSLKNKASRRTLRIGRSLVNILLDQEKANKIEVSFYGDKWSDHGIVFPSRSGFVYIMPTVTNCAFHMSKKAQFVTVKGIAEHQWARPIIKRLPRLDCL